MTSSSTVTIQSVALGRRVENRYLVLLLLEDLREHVVSRGQLLPGRVALPERLVAFALERRAFSARGVALPAPLAQARSGVLQLLQEVFVGIAIVAPCTVPYLRLGRRPPYLLLLIKK